MVLHNRHKTLALWFAKTAAARTLDPGGGVKMTNFDGLFFFFRLFLGRSEPFQPLEQLFLGHAVACDFGIVCIGRGPGRAADERRALGLGLVDLDVFLQRMDKLDRKSTRLNSSHSRASRMPSSA